MSSRSQAELIKCLSDVFEEKIERLVITFTEKLTVITEQNKKILTENVALKDLNNILISRIKSLEARLDNEPPIAVSDDTILGPEISTNRAACDKFGQPIADDNSFDILLLSDSIYRHVGGACPKTTKGPSPAIHRQYLMHGKRVKKVIVPGGRCPRLLAEAAMIAQHHVFNEVIVHVGTNYVYSAQSPEETADEIENFLQSLTALMPASLISFSQVLPRILGEGAEISETLNAIRLLNVSLRDACQFHRLGFIEHADFQPIRGRIDRTLLARDGCHLSFHGVAAIEQSLRDHIEIFHQPFIKY